MVICTVIYTYKKPYRSITTSLWKWRVDIDIDEQDINNSTPSRHKRTTNPSILYRRNIASPNQNHIICMIPQPEDATITKTSVVEIGDLEHARKQYPGCVESGEDLPEIAEDN